MKYEQLSLFDRDSYQGKTNKTIILKETKQQNHKKFINLEKLTISTPEETNEMYRFSLNGEEVKAKTLRFGIVKLFNALGIIPAGINRPDDLLVGILEKYPETANRNTLIGILKGRQLDQVKA